MLFTALAWLFLALPAAAADEVPHIALDNELAAFRADAHAGFWIDPTGTAEFSQVLLQPQRFEPAQTNRLYPLDGTNTLWLRLRLARPVTATEHWMLVLPHPQLSRVTVWQQQASGQWQAKRAGTAIPVSQWPEPGRYPVFPLQFSSAETEVYLQVSSAVPTSVPLRLSSDIEHVQQMQQEQLLLGLLFGALLLILVACIVQSMVIWDRAYALYAAYAGITIVGNACSVGLGAYLVWSNSAFLAQRGVLLAGTTACACALLFFRNLTSLGYRHRRLTRAAWFGGWGGFALLPATVLLPYAPATAVLVVYSTFAMVVNQWMATVSALRGDPTGRWVMAAHLPVVLAVSTLQFAFIGWLPFTAWVQHAMMMALTIEVPLLLLALSIRTRDRHGARIREQTLWTHDPLTGLLAPHEFEKRLKRAIGRYQRDHEDAAVMYIDLANYDAIKLQLGPSAAERCLLHAVIKLRRLVRDIDSLARLGESRFGLIMDGIGARVVITDRMARLIAAGLIPSAGMEPQVSLHFRASAVLLRERTVEPEELPRELAAALASMSNRTRRPVRFLEPDVLPEKPSRTALPDSNLAPTAAHAPTQPTAFEPR